MLIDNSVSYLPIFEWNKQFREGRDDVEDGERPGRPVTVGTEAPVQKKEKVRRIANFFS